jgi:RecA-family ATPase
MAKRFAPRRWAVRPFFPEGLTVLAGPPGLGKSYFALNLALSVAGGGNAFGVLPTEPGNSWRVSSKRSVIGSMGIRRRG